MNVLLAAGGTGGHLFPAAALAAALQARGIVVDLATDDRALKYGGDFPARGVHAIPSATPTRAGLAAKAQAAAALGLGVVAAARLIRRLKPAAVVGFGGYPTVPPLVAASLLRVPGVLHEQNAVLGRANAFLSRRVAVHRRRLSRSRRPCAGAAGQADLHRQSRAPGGAERGADALSRFRGGASVEFW